MKLPLSWLSDYTDMNGITPKEYDAKLTMSGSKVEEVYYLGAEIDNVVTGKILEVVDHPDSDLSLIHISRLPSALLVTLIILTYSWVRLAVPVIWVSARPFVVL